MIRFFCFSVAIVLLLSSSAPAQKRRLNDVELMLMVLNNGHTRAVLRDSTLFVYVIKGNTTISAFRECAWIASAKRLVVVTPKGIQEERVRLNP